MSMQLTFKAPARIVLFGEHQDYLGLPVIPAAVDLYMYIEGKKHSKFHIKLPDIKSSDTFNSSDFKYQGERDYLRSGVRILQREGIIPNNQGAKAVIYSQIPMQAGLSSSSALNVIWIKFLSELFGYKLTEMEITILAHKAEVLEFNEPGGMQDHMAITHGFVNYEEFDPTKCTRLRTKFPGLVIGNSLERKDTLNTLAKIKNGVHKGLSYLEVQNVKELTTYDIEALESDVQEDLDLYSLKSLKAAVVNYEITKKAYLELKKSTESHDEKYIGDLMSLHHQSLRDNLDVSTPKIEKMIEAAMNAGALGCKITGSGNGGCMVAYCPGAEKEVYQAIEKVGAQAYIANIVPGVSRFEKTII